MRLPAAVVPALAPLSAIVVLLALIAAQGGFATGTWALTGLFLLALLVLVHTLDPPGAEDRSRLVTLGLALYAAFTVWTFLSMLWADAPGLAWEGADRVLLHGLVLAVVCLRPWRRPVAELALALIAAGTTVAAAVVLLRTILVDEPARLFLTGRLAEPLEYANATANLYLIGLWPALHFAVSPRPGRIGWVVRGLGLAAAGVLTQTALLSQSRGALIAFAAAAVVGVALAPRRWAALLALAAVVACAAAGFGTLAEVRNADTIEQLESTLADARVWIFATAGLLAAVGAIAALIGPRLPEALGRPAVRRGGDAALALLVVAGAVAGILAVGSPGRWVEDRWQDFKSTGYEQVESGETRFGGSLGSNRYDFYRVAWAEFRARPVTGIGADNFGAAYLRQRDSPEAPRYAHSLPFSLLSQLGLVGFALFAAAIGSFLVAAVLRRRRGGAAEAAVIAAALAGFAAFMGHALVDWLWEFPTLAGLALVLLGLAARVVPAGTPVARPRAGAPVRVAAIGAAAVVAMLALAGPGSSARFVSTATRASDAATAFGWLDRAASANPFSAEPLLTEGVLARRNGDLPRATASLREAIGREPRNWFGHFELALVLAEDGDRRGALASARRAERLNPAQPLIGDLQERLRSGARIDAGAYESALSSQLGNKLTPLGS